MRIPTRYISQTPRLRQHIVRNNTLIDTVILQLLLTHVRTSVRTQSTDAYKSFFSAMCTYLRTYSARLRIREVVWNWWRKSTSLVLSFHRQTVIIFGRRDSYFVCTYVRMIFSGSVRIRVYLVPGHFHITAGNKTNARVAFTSNRTHHLFRTGYSIFWRAGRPPIRGTSRWHCERNGHRRRRPNTKYCSKIVLKQRIKQINFLDV